VHFENARAGNKREELAVFVRFEIGAAILAVLLLAVASTASAASAASTLTGAAVIAAATLAVVIIAVTPAASTTAPSFSFGHVTQSPYLLPATSEESARGRKKEIRMREIEVRHLPGGPGPQDAHPVKQTRLRIALVDIVASHWSPQGA
jgi:hypothetical protein